jgi:hypothetical protein
MDAPMPTDAARGDAAADTIAPTEDHEAEGNE